VRNELPCTVRWGDTDLYWCVSCWKGLNGLDEVVQHMDDKSRFGNWKKEQLDYINSEVKRLQAIAARLTAYTTEVPDKEVQKVEVPVALTAELRAFLEPIVAANEKFIALWKQGKTGPLIGVARKAAAGKYEGKHIEKVLGEIVNGRSL
jgi:hypothetical protein